MQEIYDAHLNSGNQPLESSVFRAKEQGGYDRNAPVDTRNNWGHWQLQYGGKVELEKKIWVNPGEKEYPIDWYRVNVTDLPVHYQVSKEAHEKTREIHESAVGFESGDDEKYYSLGGDCEYAEHKEERRKRQVDGNSYVGQDSNEEGSGSNASGAASAMRPFETQRGPQISALQFGSEISSPAPLITSSEHSQYGFAEAPSVVFSSASNTTLHAPNTHYGTSAQLIPQSVVVNNPRYSQRANSFSHSQLRAPSASNYRAAPSADRNQFLSPQFSSPRSLSPFRNGPISATPFNGHITQARPTSYFSSPTVYEQALPDGDMNRSNFSPAAYVNTSRPQRHLAVGMNMSNTTSPSTFIPGGFQQNQHYTSNYMGVTPPENDVGTYDRDNDHALTNFYNR